MGIVAERSRSDTGHAHSLTFLAKTILSVHQGKFFIIKCKTGYSGMP